MDDEVMEEMENDEATGLFEYVPSADQLTETEILYETFLDDYEDFDATDILDEEFGFLTDDD